MERPSQTSSKPPRQPRRSGGPRGARPGHPGKGPTLLSPTEVHLIEPAPCAGGSGALLSLAPSYTHPVIELPPMDMDLTHFVFHQGPCARCGKHLTAQVPPEHQAGYGPRLTAPIGELVGLHRTPGRLVQDFWHSVLHIPRSLGAVHKLIDRVSHAILPHDGALATVARQALVGYLDETPWYCRHTFQWLGTLTTETVALSLMHPLMVLT